GSGGQGLAHLEQEDLSQGMNGNQESRVLEPDPGLMVFAVASGADQQMGVRMVEHGAGPGMQHRQDVRGSSQPLGIGGEGQNGGRGRAKQCSINNFLMLPG